MPLTPTIVLQLKDPPIQMHHFEYPSLLFLNGLLNRNNLLNNIPNIDLGTKHLINQHRYVKIAKQTA